MAGVLFKCWLRIGGILSLLEIFTFFPGGLSKWKVTGLLTKIRGSHHLQGNVQVYDIMQESLFRLLWLKIDGTGWFRWVYHIYQGNPSFVPKGHLWLASLLLEKSRSWPFDPGVTAKCEPRI